MYGAKSDTSRARANAGKFGVQIGAMFAGCLVDRGFFRSAKRPWKRIYTGFMKDFHQPEGNA